MATTTASFGTVFGNKRIWIANVLSIADDETTDTGLQRIDAVFTQITDDAAAADAITPNSTSAGVITWKVDGTVSGAYVLAIGE